MNLEQLMNMLHEAGLDDAACKALFEEGLAKLNEAQEPAPAPNPEEQEAAEKAEASKMLGVDL